MKIETHLDHQTILANQARPVFFAVRISADALAQPRPRPAAFCLVLDRSGSMAGAPLEHAKQAAALAVKHLRAGDQFSLVTFESDAQVVVPLQSVKNKAAVQQAIADIRDAGSTNLSGGWMLGRDELRKAPAGAARRLLLLSDGHLNAGMTDPVGVQRLVSSGLEQDAIRTACLGFGDGYNEDLMAELARSTNGAFYDADSPEKLPGIFTAELDGLQRLAAQNVRLRLKRLDFCETMVPLGEYPATQLPDGRWEFALGDFVCEEERVVCFALEVLPLPFVNHQPVASLEGEQLLGIEVAFDELNADSVVSRTFTQTVRIQATQDPGQVKQNGEVIGWVAVQRAGKVLQEVTRRMDAGDADAAHALLREAAAEFRAYAPNPAVQDALRSIDDVERQIAEHGWTGRSRKNARYSSASNLKMSSEEAWSSNAQAPSYKRRRGQNAAGPQPLPGQPPRPHGNCYWLQPGRLLAGEYPGNKDPNVARPRLGAHLDCGVTYFLDLTEDGELAPYQSDLRALATARGAAVEYRRMPVVDLSVPRHKREMVAILDAIDAALAAGHCIYVHCWGGVGRTGTVIGCHLVRHGQTGEEALRTLANHWSGVEKAWRKTRSPETDRQCDYVRRWAEPRKGNQP